MKVLVRAALAALLVGLAVLAWQALAPRAAAPVASFTLLDGSKHTSASLKGKVVLVNFWATSCTTCVKEMPEIVATYQKFHARGFETVAVAMSYDPPAYVVNFAQTRELPFKVALDTDGSVAQAYGGVRLTPTTFVLDKEGRVVKQYLGAPDFVSLHQLIDRLLAA